jgi:glycosyltransferase involved in cell wall biosynthesis
MKIAIDSGPLTSGHAVRGIGVYTRELLKAIKIDGVDVTKTDISKYDLVHLTSFKPFEVSLPFSKPKGTKFVLTIYDFIPLVYPDHYPTGIRGGLAWQINKYLIKKNVDAIVTISETSKKDIVRFLGIDPKIVHVIYLAPRQVFKKLEIRNSKLEIAKRHGLPEHFAMYVGDVNYNKNIPNLVKACKIAKIPLVICGKQAKEIDTLDLNHAELKHLKNIDWTGVIRLGFVSDEDLVAIYNLATVYVQPSFYEGFGLPAIEAVACDTPVSVARSQCMIEVLGDDFAYCDPNDAKAMAKAILDPNKDKKLPRIYSWEKTAKETLEVYENA